MFEKAKTFARHLQTVNDKLRQTNILERAHFPPQLTAANADPSDFFWEHDADYFYCVHIPTGEVYRLAKVMIAYAVEDGRAVLV